MTLKPLDLLRALGSGILPNGAPERSTPASGTAFQNLLARAQEGAISSGLGVTIDADLPLSLTDEQMQRLTEAADRAQVSGASVALVRLDGQLLRLDVAERRVTQVVDLRQGDVLTGIDAIVEASATEAATAPIEWPSSLISNTSLLKALASASA